MARRPGGVTFVAVIVWILGLLQILAGIVALLGAAGVFTVAAPVGVGLLAFGIIEILLGIIVIVLASSLGRGSNAARVILTIFLVISMIGSVLGMLGGAQQVPGNVISLLLALIGVIFLYTGRANDFFRSRG